MLDFKVAFLYFLIDKAVLKIHFSHSFTLFLIHITGNLSEESCFLKDFICAITTSHNVQLSLRSDLNQIERLYSWSIYKK